MMKLYLSLAIGIFISTGLFADGVQPEGSGTEVDPYQVETLDNLLWISTNYTSWDKHFIQTANIDAYETQNWNEGNGFEPIGNSNNYVAFEGIYDGMGHTITGLFIDRLGSEDIGLFGYTHYAYIENLGLVDVYIRGSSLVGALVGYVAGSYIRQCYSTGFINGGEQVGGLVGYCLGSHCENSYSKCVVVAFSRAGGLIGSISGMSFIRKCYSSGNVTADYQNGGLIGYDHNSNQIDDSFWDIETSTLTSSAGGTGKTTEEMKDVATFTSLITIGLDNPWDFVGNPFNDMGTEDYWNIDSILNDGYPFLNNLFVSLNENVIQDNYATSLSNYPNPFNPITTISFDIKENESGILKIFNINGQIIESHQFESGNNSYRWDASKQASGIYFYKLITSNVTHAKKMLLLK